MGREPRDGGRDDSIREAPLATRVGPIRADAVADGGAAPESGAGAAPRRFERRPVAETRGLADRRAPSGQGVGRFLRVFLPLAAIALVAAVLLQSESGGGGKLPLLDKVKLGAGIQVVNPRYNGATSDGAPFSISAAVARPDGPDPVEIALEKVSGTFSMQEDNPIAARADGGIYNRVENVVRFNGDVTVESADGYKMRSNSAEVDLESMTIYAKEPVSADGPAGELQAGSMRAMQDDGGVVWFENGVRVTIRRLVESRATGE